MSTGAKIAIIVSSTILIGGGIFAYFYFKRKEQKKILNQTNTKINPENTNAKQIKLKQQNLIKEKIAMPSNIKELSKK